MDWVEISLIFSSLGSKLREIILKTGKRNDAYYLEFEDYNYLSVYICNESALGDGDCCEIDRLQTDEPQYIYPYTDTHYRNEQLSKKLVTTIDYKKNYQ